MLYSQTQGIAKATLVSKSKNPESCYQNTTPQQLAEQLLKGKTARFPFLFNIKIV